jgi:hypothetical protein
VAQVVQLFIIMIFNDFFFYFDDAGRFIAARRPCALVYTGEFVPTSFFFPHTATLSSQKKIQSQMPASFF